MKFWKRIFDKRISDETTRGYNVEEIKRWLGNVKEIDSFKYYYYPPHAKFPADSRNLRNQPVREVLAFLNGHFSESPNLFVEIQRKVHQSGKQEIVLRGIDPNGEVTKLGILSVKKS